MPDDGLRERLLTLSSRALAPFVSALAGRLGESRDARHRWEARGVFPLREHYYSPVFDPARLPARRWSDEDPLAGIDWNEDGQLALLEALVPHAPAEGDLGRRLADGVPRFTLDNPNFGPGDAEMLYAVLRLVRPRRVIEVGSGWSTLVAVAARSAHDQAETTGGARPADARPDPAEHVCIEPYEMPWLESLPGVRVERRLVEDLPLTFFSTLGDGDVLFIDSSHVLRMGGDVEHLYLRVLPSLQPGVLVHVHDIFLPRPYPRAWLEQWRFWNEAQLLQAFLAFNAEFEVLLALNYLSHSHREAAAAVAQSLTTREAEPGSFWLRRRGTGSRATLPGDPGRTAPSG